MEKINESLNTLEKIYNPIFEKCVNEKFSNNTKNFQMLVKIGANLSLVYFALNKCNDASTLINNIIAIIEKEVSLQKQLSVIQTFIFILFKVDTLRDKNKIKESYFNYDNDLNDSHKEDYKSIVKTLMNGFNNYLRDGIIDNWINVLKKVFSKMEHINDYKGLIFILFNQEASKYMKESSINYPLNNNNLTESKNKISSLIFSLKNNIKLLAITLFALTFLGCGGNANQRAYERYQYDSARIEFIYPKEDTVVLEEEQESDWMDDGGGLIEIPDIPKERSINMNANNYEVEKMMSGKQ